MICPTCGLRLDSVIDTRAQADHTRRRRVCPNGHRFTTREEIVASLWGRTPPEVEKGVLEAVAGGLNYRQITSHFDISETTIRRIISDNPQQQAAHVPERPHP